MVKNYRQIIRAYVTENVCAECKNNNAKEGVIPTCKKCILTKSLDMMDVPHNIWFGIGYAVIVILLMAIIGFSLCIKAIFALLVITSVLLLIIYMVYIGKSLIDDMRGIKDEH